MSDIMPEGENIRKAIRWISALREEKKDLSLFALIGEAC
jgi:hypothetical protein